MPLDDREKRMQLFAGFMQQIRTRSRGASDQVSEVDLSDAEDLRATLDGLQPGSGSLPGGVTSGAGADSNDPLLVHFGDTRFRRQVPQLWSTISRQWRATAGRVESVDLRFAARWW